MQLFKFYIMAMDFASFPVNWPGFSERNSSNVAP